MLVYTEGSGKAQLIGPLYGNFSADVGDGRAEETGRMAYTLSG